MGYKTIQVTLRHSHFAPKHLEAVQRLCDTEGAQKTPTDTKTVTSPEEQDLLVTGMTQ